MTVEIWQLILTAVGVIVTVAAGVSAAWMHLNLKVQKLKSDTESNAKAIDRVSRESAASDDHIETRISSIQSDFKSDHKELQNQLKQIFEKLNEIQVSLQNKADK